MGVHLVAGSDTAHKIRSVRSIVGTGPDGHHTPAVTAMDETLANLRR
jgi:hypothetical protein